VDQPGDPEDPHHLPPRCGEHQVAARLPGLLPAAGQGGHAAGVDELQAVQVHDDPRIAGGDGDERGRHVQGVLNVKLPAQLDHGVIAVAADA
jgi:hypothetical protein